MTTPQMMGFSVPMRAGPAPCMFLDPPAGLEGKLPAFDIKIDADSLQVVENYQDD